ncbi:hypothetical protein ASF71_19920 [Deinococcus sp. Leaf326]|nr:hypothetical protein ASF71_19920 [Deinococcus sp. Leaf326]
MWLLVEETDLPCAPGPLQFEGFELSHGVLVAAGLGNGGWCLGQRFRSDLGWTTTATGRLRVWGLSCRFCQGGLLSSLRLHFGWLAPALGFLSTARRGAAPPLRLAPLDGPLRPDTFEQHAGRFVVRVLWHQFAPECLGEQRRRQAIKGG